MAAAAASAVAALKEQHFILEPSRQYGRPRYKPTLIKRHADTGILAEEHWLSGPAGAPRYVAPSMERPYNMRTYDKTGTTAYSLTGPYDAPLYAQPFFRHSVEWTRLNEGQIIRHWLRGKLHRGTYSREDGSPDTLAIDETGTRAQFVWVRAQGLETQPILRSERGQPTVYELDGDNVLSFWLYGELPTPVRYRSLNAMSFRHNASDNGYAAQFGTRRVWARGTWKFALIERASDSPTIVSEKSGVRRWVDGILSKHRIQAVFWRRDKRLPTEENPKTRRKTWLRGNYPETRAMLAISALPDRVSDIVRYASYQLGGTCYLNAAFNLLVCTPCLRNMVIGCLNDPTPFDGCAYEQAMLDMLHEAVCDPDLLMQPSRQSNAMVRIERDIGLSGGGFGFTGAMFFGQALQLSISMRIIFRGGMRGVTSHPDVNTSPDLVLISTQRPAVLTPTFMSATGARYTMVGAVLVGYGHVVAALQDTLGEPNIILDSNGSVENAEWFPEVLSPVWSKFSSFTAWYVSDAILHARQKRCSPVVFAPRVRVVPELCALRKAELKTINSDTGSHLETSM